MQHKMFCVVIICIVKNITTDDFEEYYSLSEAKKAMKDLIKNGYEVSGLKYKVYSDGDFELLGKIELTGSNAHFVANTRQKNIGYK